MLPGFGGHLISEFFLERRLEEDRSLDERTQPLHRTLSRWRERCRMLGPASSRRSLLETGAVPFVVALGFSEAGQVEPLKGALAATIRAGLEPVAVIVTNWGEPLDTFWRAGVTSAARRGASWCLFFNGTHARLIEARRLYARRHVEFAIDIALDERTTFGALATILDAAALEVEPGRRLSALHAIVDESERHSAGISQALRSGVCAASTEFLGAMLTRERQPALESTFEQALTIVYRVLFLLFAEARNLVPLWHPIYRESYSVEALCDAAERTPAAVGLWDALRAVSRLAHAGCRAGDLRVTAFNGRLFSPARTPLVDRRDLDDGAARRALLALSSRVSADRQGRERIAYRDLGVGELGAVYESLLDYEPKVERVRRSAQHPRGLALSLERGSERRKATGTFYTPKPIAEYLVRRTLGPLVRDATAERILNLKVLDPAMGSGAFLVAACTYLAQAYEAALVRAGGFHSTDFGPAERVAVCRTIAERCLFGVDLNPMAVQLARLSLWLATLAADRPLSFLDHHLASGDSLLGTWLSSIRAPPSAARRRAGTPSLPLLDEHTFTEAIRLALPARFSLAIGPNDTVEHVRDKERTLSILNRRDSALSRWKRVADLWCAGWFADTPEERAPAVAFGALSDHVLTGRGALPNRAAASYLDAAERVAARQRFFHWELEFPEAFFDADGRRLPDGGFDAILGNPPWDMVRADAGPHAMRSTSREAAAAMLRFSRDSGVYDAQSSGHANRYQLFVERAVALTRPGGRIGLVLPSGLTSDHGSAPLRRLLFSRCAVDEIVGFDNTSRIFPIHRSVRFVLLTSTKGGATREIACRLGEHNAAALDARGDEADASDAWFPVRVTPALIEHLSGGDLAIPELRTPMDVTIAERAASLFPPLGGEHGWSARFGRELNATDDRAHFRPAGHGRPLVEGKAIEPFRVNADEIRRSIPAAQVRRLLADRWERTRLAYRDVASATNRLTLIAALIPAGWPSTHTVFCLRTPLALRAQHFLCGLFNSFVVNYLVRLRVATHVTTAIVERLPIPRWDHRPDASARIAALARVLTRRPNAAALADLNARVAVIYQLTEEEFSHALGTFPLVPRDERNQAMAAFLRGGD